MKIQTYAKEHSTTLQEFLETSSTRVRNRTSNTVVSSCFDHLPLLAHGGKRVRPYLVNLMYRAAGGSGDATNLELAMELFHLFGLIHDDITDRGKLRHGAPTLHELAKKLLTDAGATKNIDHIAETHAMLVGDQVFAWVHELLHSLDGDHTSAARAVFATMTEEVVAGQMLDATMMTVDEVSLEDIMTKTELKTATYTFIRPMQLGVAYAGGSNELMTFCEDFGRAVGTAFQLQDDMLDIVGNAGEVTKDLCSDVEEGQHTFYSHYVLAHGSEEQVAEFKQLFGNTLSDKDKEACKALFVDTGAIAAGKQQFEQLFDEAETVLQDAPLPKAEKTELQSLTSYIRSRLH